MARRRGRRWISPRPSESSPADVALRFLAQRPRSEHEVRERLRRAGIEHSAVEATLAQLRQHRLVDDAAFAQYWVEQRQTFKPRGARLLRAELRQHGIESATAETAAQSTEHASAEDAYRAAQRRARQLAASSAADERTFKTKLAQFLQRRGFDWDTVSSTVERLAAELLPADR